MSHSLRFAVLGGVVSLATVAGFSAGPAAGGVVFNDDFSGETAGGAPTTGSNTWFRVNPADSTVGINTSVGNSAPSIGSLDTGSGSGYTAINFGVPAFSGFNMSTPGQEVLTLQFDLRVDAFSNASNGNGSTYRVGIQDSGHYFILGFGRGGLSDGDGNSDLFFYAADTGTSNFASFISPAMAIGYTGNGWEPGFDLGTYSTTATENNTGGDFYRFSVTFTDGSTEVVVTATELATGNTATHVTTATSPYNFSNTGTDGITLLNPGSGTGTFYVDNISLTSSAIPEPATGAGLGLLGFAALRRRR